MRTPARVVVNGQERAAASVTPEQVCVDLTAADLANPGTLSLGVSVGGVLSGPATLTINAPLPTIGEPTVGEPTPIIIIAGTPSAQICLPGINFTLDAQLLVNGLPRVVTSVSPNQICFTLTGGDLVAPGSPDFEAITELAERGIILGFEPETCRLLGQSHPCFGPNEPTLRAQMAALIARASGWASEEHGNPFPDRGPVDEHLWRNVGTLAFYNVARGYPDGTYKPLLPVAQVQTISFITRSMVALGYWRQQPDNRDLYPNVPASSGHREDLATYVHYLGAIPGTTPTAAWPTWAQPASRAFFSESQFKAVQWREDPANYGPTPRP